MNKNKIFYFIVPLCCVRLVSHCLTNLILIHPCSPLVLSIPIPAPELPWSFFLLDFDLKLTIRPWPKYCHHPPKSIAPPNGQHRASVSRNFIARLLIVHVECSSMWKEGQTLIALSLSHTLHTWSEREGERERERERERDAPFCFCAVYGDPKLKKVFGHY